LEKSAGDGEIARGGRPGGSNVASPQPAARHGEPTQVVPANGAAADRRPRLDGVIGGSRIRAVAGGAADGRPSLSRFPPLEPGSGPRSTGGRHGRFARRRDRVSTQNQPGENRDALGFGRVSAKVAGPDCRLTPVPVGSVSDKRVYLPQSCWQTPPAIVDRHSATTRGESGGGQIGPFPVSLLPAVSWRFSGWRRARKRR
jgi:hypothetical protein